MRIGIRITVTASDRTRLEAIAPVPPARARLRTDILANMHLPRRSGMRRGVGRLKQWAVALLAAMIALALTGCGQGAYTHRFRLVVEVLVDGEVKSGFSVIEVTTWESGGWGFSEAGGIRTRVTGEAAFVDLGAKGNVVALLRFPPPHTNIVNGLAESAFKVQNPDLDWKQVPSLKGQADLTGQLRPYLVSFSDVNDPTSVIVLTPDQFGTVFGSGVVFKRVYIEMTDKPPSNGSLEKKMPWVSDWDKTVAAWKAMKGRGFDSGGSSIGTQEMFIRREE